MIPPIRCDGDNVKTSGGGATTGRYLRAALEKLGLARLGLGWYEATRHTFASQWVLSGGSIEKLREILGHYSVIVTERYTHLRPDLFAARDLSTIPLSLKPGSPFPVHIGQQLGSNPPLRARRRAELQEKSRSGSVSRVLSASFEAVANIRLGPWLPRSLVSEHTRELRTGRPISFETLPYWLLLRVGFAMPAESPRPRCALTAPFHPYLRQLAKAVYFLWHCPADRSDWPLASTLPCEARTFLPSARPAPTGVRPSRSDKKGI